MGFTTQIFVYIFMPFFFMAFFISDFLEKNNKLGIYIKKFRVKDLIIVVFSIGFYIYAGIIEGGANTPSNSSIICSC